MSADGTKKNDDFFNKEKTHTTKKCFIHCIRVQLNKRCNETNQQMNEIHKNNNHKLFN